MRGILRRFASATLRFAAPVIALVLCGGIAAAATQTGAIAYVGTDDQIYYAPQVSAHPHCLTCPYEGTQVRRDTNIVPVAQGKGEQSRPRALHYGWPTFSPDGNKIAFASVSAGGKDQEYALWVYDLRHPGSTRIFQSHTERVIYMQWLADSRHLSFLLGEPDGLSLMLARVDHPAPIRIVMTGMPLYFDWNDTRDRLAVHTAGSDPETSERVSLIAVTKTDQHVDKILSHGRSPFMAPAWSPDGKHLAYIANYGVEANLVVANPDGTHPRSIVSLPVGDNSFVWMSDSRRILYSTTIVPHEPVFGGIRVVDIASANSRILTKDPVDAYFPSPDGRYVAYVSVPKQKPFYWWKIIDLQTGKVRELTRFLSTDQEDISYRFFNQFALSHTIWSPDSSAFVFAGGRLLVDPGDALSAVPPPSVWVVPADGQGWQNIGHGTLAYFSPASGK